MFKKAHIPRSELLSWINSFLQTSYTTLEDASNGAVACQIIDAIHPGIVPMHHLDFTASSPYECQKNYQVLNKMIRRLNLPFNINVADLSKQGSVDSYDFMSRLKAYFDEHFNNEPYDAVQKRRTSKGSLKVTRAETSIKKVSTPESKIIHNDLNVQVFNSDESEPLTSPSCTSPRSFYVPSDEYIKIRKELDDVKAELTDLKQKYDKRERIVNLFKKRECLLVRERSFYYDKLITIENMLVTLQEKRPLNDIEKSIISVLYSTDGLQNSMNSDDRASEGEYVPQEE